MEKQFEDIAIERKPLALTQEQGAELRRIKAYFPYRIVWGQIDKTTGEFSAHGTLDKRLMNKAARSGNLIFLLN